MFANNYNWDLFWKDTEISYSKISWSKKRIINLLTKHIKKNQAIIDAGCGTGFFSNFFFLNNMNVFAVDYSERALKLCQALNSNLKLLKLDILNERLLKYLNYKVDFVFSDGLLEHFSFFEQKRILNNLRNSLRLHGKIISIVPNKFSPWQIIRPFYMPNIKEKPFIIKELVRLHENCGFKTIEAGGINVLPFAYSPEKILGKSLGMLLYYIGEKI